MSESRVPEQARIYNLVTSIMVILTFAVCITVAYFSYNAEPSAQFVAEEPTLFLIPTETPTLVGPTVNPTWTVTPTTTLTVTPIPSRTPTVTPTETPTSTVAPTNTPRPTETRTPTITPTKTNTPVGGAATNTPDGTNTTEPTKTNTPVTSGDEYELRNGQGPTFTQNNNSDGCNWAGIAGLIFDKNDNHQLGIRIHIFNDGSESFFRNSGSKTDPYGESGWEQKINDHPVAQKWYVQVVDANGNALSPRVTVNTHDSCTENLAMVQFKEKGD
jgi:hypothetical protein